MERFFECGSGRDSWWDQGADYHKGVEVTRKGEQGKQASKNAPPAGVHVARVDSSQAASSRTPKKCKLTELAGCTGSHPAWLYTAFRGKVPEERSKIIADNKLCPFCLLHNSDSWESSNNISIQEYHPTTIFLLQCF
jgi:hypothetical protein